MYQFLRTKRVYVNQHKLWQITFWPAWPWYVNQHSSMAKIHHWWYVIILSIATQWLIVVCCFHLSICCWCWLFVVSIVYALVHDNIPLESVRNYAVCKSLHFNYPQRCILPQNETKYTCERLCILPQIVTNYMYTDVCTHWLFIPQVQPKWQWRVWGGCRCLLLML